MPPKQVYGKRSRAVYDPFQAFVSPQRPAPKGNIREQGVFVAEVVEELSRLKVEERRSEDGRKGGRRALGEKSANETVDPVKLVVGRRKTERRIKKKAEQVDEDVENRQAQEQDVRTEGQPRRRIEKFVERPQIRPKEASHDFVPDNVPMFVDGYGYDTEDEAAKSQILATETPSTQSHPKETSQDSCETPSISILPPTPPAEEDKYTTHCSSLLKLSSHGLIDFSEWSNELSSHFSITKIAEASFGEVYRLSLLKDLSSFSHTDESVLKIISLKPPESSLPPKSKKKERSAALKKAEAMSTPEDVANEVHLLQRMSTIPGFTNFRDVRIVQGRPPQPFIKAFKDFNTEQKARKKDLSVFPDPGKKTSYADDQLWAIIEMQDAGEDLERIVERGECGEIWTVWDVFWQVVLTLAKGEEGAEFEHRDLHLGNVCVRKRPQPLDTADEGRGTEEAIDIKRKFNFTGLETTIIDYTISRALLEPSTTTTSSLPPSESIAFHDLSTPISACIFEGDGEEEYQYDIYRYMRGCVLADDPYHVPDPAGKPLQSAEGETPWKAYHPRTNLIWLHFLLHSLLESLSWPSATKAPPKKRNAGRDFAVWKKANDLEHALLTIQDLLDPAAICADEGLGSAGALVGWALDEGWLDEGDVVGDHVGDEEEQEDGLVDGVEGLDLEREERVVGEGDTLGVLARVDKETERCDERKDGRTGRKR